MKHIRVLLIPGLALACLPAARAAGGASLESLKAATLSSSWESALRTPPSIPAAQRGRPAAALPLPLPLQTQLYARGGYASEWEAQDALRQAETNMGSAGLAALGSQVFPEAQGQTYGFRVDYADQDHTTLPPRTIETYTSGFFSGLWEAQDSMERTVRNLRASGYALIMARMLQQPSSPWNHYYQVDYVGDRRQPGGGRDHVYRSGLYLSASQAQRDMVATAYNLQTQGYVVTSQQIFRLARQGRWYYFYEVRYRSRWPGSRRELPGK